MIELIKCNEKLGYDYMSFEGGGAKGIAYLGALEILSRTDILNNLKGYAGVSAGSIPATLFAIGMSSSQVAFTLVDMDFSEFKDDTFGWGRDIFRLLRKYGIYKGKVFEDWFESVLYTNSCSNGLTFEQAFKMTGKRLVVAATNYTKGYIKIFNNVNTPNVRISVAVRASIAIPFVFVPVLYNGSILVDGGTLCNYYVFPEYMGKTLGLYLVSDNEYNVMSAKPKGFKDYLIRYIDLFQHNLEKRFIPEKQWVNTIKIPTGSISATNFDLHMIDKIFLMKSGKLAATNFLIKKGIII